MMHPHESRVCVCIFKNNGRAIVVVLFCYFFVYILMMLERVNYVYRWIKSDTGDSGCVGSLGHNNNKNFTLPYSTNRYMNTLLYTVYRVATLPSWTIFHILQMTHTFTVLWIYMYIFDLMYAYTKLFRDLMWFVHL